MTRSMDREAGVFSPEAQAQRLGADGADLVKLALDKGANEAESYAVYRQTASASFQKNDLKLAQLDEYTGYGLRVFREHKQGFSSTNQRGRAALAQAAADACTLAGMSLADEANQLPAPAAAAAPAMQVEPAIAQLSLEEVVARGHAFVDRINRRDPRISIDKASFSVTRTTRAICSSRGVAAAASDAYLSLSAFGMAVDGQDVGSFDYAGDLVRELQRADAAAEVCAERFCDAVLGNLGAGPADSYTGPVLFSPSALLSIFVFPVVSAAGALAVQRERSALSGKLGQRIASPSLSIIDDPEDRSLGGARAFDREGQPCARFPILHEGVLSSYLYNAYTAHSEGRRSTGHAQGGDRQAPGLGPHAITVAPEKDGESFDGLLSTLGRGLYVQRFSGTVKPESGDFSGVAKGARWVERGQVVRALKETLISGNVFALLPQLRLGAESQSVSGYARAPHGLVDGVTVLGAR